MSYLSKNNSYRILNVNSLPVNGEERVIYKLSGSSVMNVWNTKTSTYNTPSLVSDFNYDYYFNKANVTGSNYSGSVRQVVIVNDETNSNTTSLYTFNGSDLIQVPQSILDRIVALEYVPLTINSFTNNVNNVEKGTTVTSITFSHSFNKTPSTSSIDNSIGNISGSSTTRAVNLTTNITYTLTASDGQTTRTSTTSVNFLNKVYYGTSANTTLNSSQVLALSNNVLSSTKNRTITLNGNGQYIYYCYPASMGDAIFNINGLTATLIKATLSVTNSLGDVTSYNIYRTSNIQNATGITITIS
jgi:hypothetical protein